MVGGTAPVACSPSDHREARVTLAGAHDSTPELLTLAEAAALLRTPVATLRYWWHLGIGPKSFRLGRRVVTPADLISWLTEQREATGRRQGHASW